MPIIGLLPDTPTITVLGGVAGQDLALASVLGDVAADLALHGGTDRPVGAFSPRRFGIDEASGKIGGEASSRRPAPAASIVLTHENGKR
jgi:hypothetical protein